MQAENEGGAGWVCVRQWALLRALKIYTNAGQPPAKEPGLSTAVSTHRRVSLSTDIVSGENMKNSLPNRAQHNLGSFAVFGSMSFLVAIESPSTSSTSPPVLTTGSMLDTIYTIIHHLTIMTQPVRLHSRV